MSLARWRAKQIVKANWLAQGHSLREVRLRDVVGWVEDYIAAHPELLADAVEEVRRTPELQRLVRRRSAELSSHAQFANRCGARVSTVHLSGSEWEEANA